MNLDIIFKVPFVSLGNSTFKVKLKHKNLLDRTSYVTLIEIKRGVDVQQGSKREQGKPVLI